MTFQRNITAPSSGKSKPRRPACCYFLLASCLSYSLTLEMEAICSSEKLVNFYWTAWHSIPDDSTSSQPDNLLDKNINTIKKNTDLYLIAKQ
jgi:hypothetical protein